VVAIEVDTGRIVALVGGDAVEPGGFDRASGALRQPGSAFKPFVYLEALRTRRYTPASMLDDSPEVQGDWKPQNSHPDEFAGAVSMRQALARSLNLPAVKLIGDVGPPQVAALARRMGVESRLDEGAALALGASSVTPLELTAAYAVLAAGGARRRPWVVERIVDPSGEDVPIVGRAPTAVVAPEEAYVLTSMMRSVIDEGTGRLARSLGRPVAGKTGTSDDQRDAWFVGYTRQLAASVWVGFDDPASIGRKEYGARAALPIWVEVMEAASAGTEARDFEAPDGLVTAMIDPASGLLAYEGMEGAVEEIFIEGTVPAETAVPPELVSLDGFMLEQAAGGYGADGGATGPTADGGPD
jgi:penicillin-binding protein 1A